MFKIRDNITGEVIEFKDRDKWLAEADRRINIHNSEYDYKYRGHHYSENAILIPNDNVITIERMSK